MAVTRHPVADKPHFQGLGGKGKDKADPEPTAEQVAAWKRIFAQPIPGGPTSRGFDEYFTSTRDGQPFVIRYGTPVSYKTAPDQILATEAVATGGKKLAVYSNGVVVKRSVDAEP